MNNKWLRILNPLLFLTVTVQIITVLGIKLFPNKMFYELHGFFGMVLIVLILVHFTLNFGWVKANFFKGK